MRTSPVPKAGTKRPPFSLKALLSRHWVVLVSFLAIAGYFLWNEHRAHISSIGMDVIVLGGFAALKLQSDPTIVVIAAVGVVTVFILERLYLPKWTADPDQIQSGHHDQSKH